MLGAVVYALDSALFFGSLERTSAPLASLVHYAHLVLVVGVAAMIGRERLTRRRLLALVGIFGGVALVGGAAVNPDLVGVGMALGSAAAYAVYILLSDRLLRDADPIGARRLSSRWGLRRRSSSRAACSARSAPSAASAGLACLVAAALVGSVFAVTSFLKGVRLVGPSTASLLVTVEVPVTIALAAVVLGAAPDVAAARGRRARRRRDRRHAVAARGRSSGSATRPAALAPAATGFGLSAGFAGRPASYVPGISGTLGTSAVKCSSFSRIQATPPVE